MKNLDATNCLIVRGHLNETEVLQVFWTGTAGPKHTQLINRKPGRVDNEAPCAEHRTRGKLFSRTEAASKLAINF